MTGDLCCTKAVYQEYIGWWCPEHGDADEAYSTLQAENLAAADVDWDAREMTD